MYKIVRSILFFFPTEFVHYFSMNALKFLLSIPFVRKIFSKWFSPGTQLQKTLFGLHFKNPVGLAAGFDKNARYLTELKALGFGYVEIGTVTPKPQAGNDKPRLFRLPKDHALINRMGFNNDGVKVVADRLREWKLRNGKDFIIGGNIGKNKMTENDDAWKDYEICFRELFDCVDYFVVNVSSPNTPGLRALQDKESLRKILSHLQTINKTKPDPKPILLKIAPDLETEQIDDVIDLALEINLDGLVATNTTISRANLKTENSRIEKIGAGGLSGLPVRERSTAIVKYISDKTGGRIPVIASGGIFKKEHLNEKLHAGAALVQVWTGFIYEGPSIVRKLLS